MIFYYRSIATTCLSCIVSEINGDFSGKLQDFPTPVYFAPLLKGFPLELGTDARGQNTRMMELPDRERSLTISSAVWIQYTNVTDGRTDGQTDGHQATAKTALTHSIGYASRISYSAHHYRSGTADRRKR